MKILVRETLTYSHSEYLTDFAYKVFLVYLLDTAHQALITHSVYKYLITNFFNPLHLGVIEDSLRVISIFNAVSQVSDA